MPRRFLLIAAALLGFAGSAMAAPGGTVDVRFVDPGRYSDANNRFGSSIGPKATLTELQRLLDQAVSPLLAPGERVVVEVLDVDLAGFPSPGANLPAGSRVVTEASPPSLRLRYTLMTERGARLASGEERVTDVNFLFGARAAQFGSFPYERDLIRDWARRRFAHRR
ncbi:DUF3016 domain-containing protein [Methylobacterium sp. 77]|uniref:DUF3016 domain-containing protein n=1 Tax=Methylobacterium sp. 77 TaxID=1101192 RepID=UPI00036D9519|nr:DUF3016 domain-containing protein [Methylobacterium sp. 77]